MARTRRRARPLALAAVVLASIVAVVILATRGTAPVGVLGRVHPEPLADRLSTLGLGALALTVADGRFDAVLVAMPGCDECRPWDGDALAALAGRAARHGLDLGYIAAGARPGAVAAGAVLDCARDLGALGVGPMDAVAATESAVAEILSARAYWLDEAVRDPGEAWSVSRAAEAETRPHLFSLGVALGLDPATAWRCLSDRTARARMRIARDWLTSRGRATLLLDMPDGGSATLDDPEAFEAALAAIARRRGRPAPRRPGPGRRASPVPRRRRKEGPERPLKGFPACAERSGVAKARENNQPERHTRSGQAGRRSSAAPSPRLRASGAGYGRARRSLPGAARARR
jgi:hypothetical protein